MKIKCSNSGVKWIFNREISEDRIEFDEKGHAIVSSEVGTMLVEAYPDIALVKSAKTKK